jgi:hypothetical protein
MPKLTISRSKAFRDRLRAYQIFLDGKQVGKVRAGRRLEVEVSPGRHQVVAKIDWCSSPAVEVDALRADINLEVGSSWNVWSLREMISRLTWRKNEYLHVKEA